jgi:dipeptidyl aminopeptidase/acylaminoacyl peptidase
MWCSASSLVLLLAAPSAALGQGTLADYERAAGIREQLDSLTIGLAGEMNWLGDGSEFWYRVTVEGGARFVLVNATTTAKQPAFDHARLAAGLSSATGETYGEITLPFTGFEYVSGRSAIEADADGSRWRCMLATYACERVGAARPQAPGGAFGQQGFGRSGGAGGEDAESVRSPDGRLEAFIQNYNVAIRPVRDEPAGRGGRGGFPGGRGGRGAAPDYTMLSWDGSEGDEYQLRSIEWSPDSRKLVAYRQRPGHSRIVHFVRSSPSDQLQPKHETTETLANRTCPPQRSPCVLYRKPGDVLDRNQPVLFDVETRSQIFVDDALFPNPYQISRPEWREDSGSWTFEYNQRGHQAYRVIEVDGTTGSARVLIDERSETFVSYRAASAGLRDTGHVWRHDIDDGREILWMSERDGWSHLYLYDGVTGQVKNQVTKGEWIVSSVDSVDVANRQIHFRALGMNPEQDPYFVHFYRISFDGTGLQAYTEGDGTHDIDWSPDRQFYVDTYSRVDMPPIVELRRASDGRRVMELERGDMSALLATGWVPPEPFVAKGRDGQTDIWGIIVRPMTFDPDRKYPILEQIYAGPQGSFVPKAWGGGQNLLPTAELGFIMVQIDGMGTNNRSKAFHDVAWRNLGDAGFPDRILWHRAAAREFAWYDTTRVGLYGGSAGGQNAAGGVLFHGDFYDAAFASSGCHDNRMDKIWWNEQWMGWPIAPHYEASSNVANAHRLKGKLFLAVGELDTNVDPASTMQLVDALIRADKSFELLVVPNGGHGATGLNGTRKRNDFFVRALIGIEPPDWNALPAPQTDELDWQDDAPPLGFFESPADGSSPFTWW